ncbi:Cytochrome P450 [Yoonia tamlensis]|uniref:Cytochrome P450 n=1 Tax=Yoonia tamlensis TaxID=390270 RepID=A0A1I6GL87_9RHOB|nr:cytochrome P450 [Yoonia tamlensis]SFR42827.1 Cytochrome P450 [Yoonia tamlensis]
MAEPFQLYSTQIDRDPFPGYADLRDNFPCYWSEDAGIWLLSRYDDVSTAAMDWQSYSSLSGNLIDEIPGRSGNTLGTTDPPRHDRLRGLTNAAFAKKNLTHLVGPITDIADRQITQIRQMGDFDFVAEFSSVVTVKVLFELLGLPVRNPKEIRSDVVNAISTDKANKGKNEGQLQSFRRITALLDTHIQERRREPADDLITHLATAEIDGDHLSPQEVQLTAAMLVVAGVESLSSFMSMFMLNLASFHDARRAIVSVPDLLPNAMEESLRFNTSAQRFKRVLTRDTILHGQTMRAGDKVALMYGAANRDPRKFIDADTFDIRRKPSGHLGFGAGKHYCLGTSLARLVTVTAIGRLLDQFPEIALPNPPEDWVASSNFRSPMALWLNTNSA